MKRIKIETDRDIVSKSIVKIVNIESRNLISHRIGNDINKIPKESIVWVYPNDKTTAEEMAAEVERISKLGAVRVLPMPLESDSAVVPRSVLDATEKITYSTVRDVVVQLLDSVKELKEEVKVIVEDALTESNL